MRTRKLMCLLAAVPLATGLSACSTDKPEGSTTVGGAGAGVTASPAEPNNIPNGVVEQYTTLNEEITGEGGQVESGEWRIAYIVEGAEAWHVPGDGKYTYRDVAAEETNHIEIIPFEAKTGRIVPDVPIRLEVLDASGKVVQGKELSQYYGEFFHYANNFAIPEPGKYTLRAVLSAPTFLRHGEKGDPPALAEGTTVTFPDVQIGS